MEEPVDAATRHKRKEEARQLKRKRIEDAGGVRPRNYDRKNPGTPGQYGIGRNKQGPSRVKEQGGGRGKGPRGVRSHVGGIQSHRFGRVMEHVPCRGQPRLSTLSIAIPGSVVSNCQTRELKTHLVGQIARAAAVYHVDEIIVFDDKLANYTRGKRGGHISHQRRQGRDRRGDELTDRPTEDRGENGTVDDKAGSGWERPRASDPHTFMARVLQYCECPQYLRRHFFPMHPDLQFAGLLSPIDAPHHVRAEERSKYREGVVLDKTGPSGKSLVNCGIRSRPVEIDRLLTKGIRCTVQLDPVVYGTTGRIRGAVVSPSAPREENGTYWGYTTRLAESIHAAFDECPFEAGYDLKIGTSERGDVTVDDKKFSLPSFRHSLIVFGGVAGIEECVDADETLRIPGSASRKLFDMWVNTCPFQGSRTIRSEEAVLITLARLSPFVANNIEARNKLECSNEEGLEEKTGDDLPSVEFSDASPSAESSDRDD